MNSPSSPLRVPKRSTSQASPRYQKDRVGVASDKGNGPNDKPTRIDTKWRLLEKGFDTRTLVISRVPIDRCLPFKRSPNTVPTPRAFSARAATHRARASDADHPSLPARARLVRVIHTPWGIPQMHLLSEQHVLDLKRCFLVEAMQHPRIRACDEYCCSPYRIGSIASSVRNERVHAVPFHPDLVHFFQSGINITNSYLKDAGSLRLLSLAPMNVLHQHVVRCRPSRLDQTELHIDWPTFLTVCTIAFLDEAEALASLYREFASSRDARIIDEEAGFHKMLATMLGRRASSSSCFPPPSARVTDSDHCPHILVHPSLYQRGDHYAARHTCHFTEVLISLQGACIQQFITNAKARGLRLHTNFCGHMTTPESTKQVVESTCADSMRSPHHPRPPTVRRQSITSAYVHASSKQCEGPLAHATKVLRYERRIFV